MFSMCNKKEKLCVKNKKRRQACTHPTSKNPYLISNIYMVATRLSTMTAVSTIFKRLMTPVLTANFFTVTLS